MKDVIVRKLIVTFVSVTVVSLAMALLFYLRDGFATPYNMGNYLMGWTMLYMMYVGAIILIYGNLVSLGLEYIQRKYINFGTTAFIVLHGMFGLANGLVFQNTMLAIAGVAAAIFYAVMDRWIYRRLSANKGILFFFLIPILIYGLSWGGLQLASEPMPPFTKADAVEFATSGEGTVTDIFPEKIGKWQGTINEYQVVRETSVKEVGDEKYIVTFTETWEKDDKTGPRYFSYKVERGTLTAHRSGGDQPPY